MAKYLLAIYGDEKQWEARTDDDVKHLVAAHKAFTEKAGVRNLMGHKLEPSSTATTLRGTVDGRPTPTDGPFLESKEALGGFYVIEAADLDEAISLAEMLPEVRAGHSGVEIRPIRELA